MVPGRAGPGWDGTGRGEGQGGERIFDRRGKSVCEKRVGSFRHPPYCSNTTVDLIFFSSLARRLLLVLIIIFN